jgi:hypothetical protein
MTKAVVVYQAGDEKHSIQVALSRRDGKTFVREFKRHTRFGKKWDTWRETSFPEVIALGFEEFKRVDKGVKVVLPIPITT